MLVLGVLLLVASQPPGGTAEADTARRARTEVVRGHRRGKAVRLVLAKVDGDIRLEIEAALFFSWMARKAKADGIELVVTSGFRTFRKQRWLFRCFESCSCNGCRRAARPGHSSHETGRAVDIDVRDPRVRAWLFEHAAEFGFVRTVRSEPWHFEYFERRK